MYNTSEKSWIYASEYTKFRTNNKSVRRIVQSYVWVLSPVQTVHYLIFYLGWDDDRDLLEADLSSNARQPMPSEKHRKGTQAKISSKGTKSSRIYLKRFSLLFAGLKLQLKYHESYYIQAV